MKPYYETDFGKLYHGDCLEIMPYLDLVDLVLTDPPYGINHSSHGQRFKKAENINGDDSLWSYYFLNNLNKPLCAFFSPYNVPKIKWNNILVWNKGPQVGIGGDRKKCWKRDFEMIGIKNNPKLNGKRDSASLYFRALIEKPSGHFCEKPIGLIVYLLNKIPSSLVIDPFLGSGSTAIAAERLNKNWIGIEIEEKYCEVAANRIEKERSQLKLFEPKPEQKKAEQLELI